MKIFISHASKNMEIVTLFSEFLESINTEIEVFSSSENGAISVGRNFVKAIFDELNSCNLFIPIISKEYFESKFCMLELGTAFSYLYNKYQLNGEDYIFPFSVLPITKGEALSGTPLSNIQVGEINNEDDIRTLIDFLKENGNINITTGTNRKIHSVKIQIDQILTKNQNIVSLANIFTCCDNKAAVKHETDVAQYSAENSNITVNYNFDPYDEENFIYPNFISLVLKYVDEIDFTRYLNYNDDSKLRFTLSNFTNSLKKIWVEFKYSSNIQILRKFELPLTSGDNNISIPLKDMRSNALGHISEICFVIHPNDVTEKEGMFIIKDIKVE